MVLASRRNMSSPVSIPGIIITRQLQYRVHIWWQPSYPLQSDMSLEVKNCHRDPSIGARLRYVTGRH